MIGIVDLRSLDYYKIKQGILQQNLAGTIGLKEHRLSENISINL